MRILDLSKILIYVFHYDYIKTNMATNRNFYLDNLFRQFI